MFSEEDRLPVDWKEQIRHLPNGHLFIPGKLVRALYANRILDRESYLRYKKAPQVLNELTNEVYLRSEIPQLN